MDASAYLKRHGWRGLGHSLDSTDNGLKRPLLISKKVDVLGIGINRHDVIADQWWMKAYDSGLKDFGTGKKGLLAQVAEHGVKRGGLYGRFVKGEGVPGTFEVEAVDVVDGAGNGLVANGSDKVDASKEGRKSKKRKAVDEGLETGDGTTKKKQRKDRKGKKNGDMKLTADEARALKKAVKKLSETKRAQYEEGAKRRGMTLEAYVQNRLRKNAGKATAKKGEISGS